MARASMYRLLHVLDWGHAAESAESGDDQEVYQDERWVVERTKPLYM